MKTKNLLRSLKRRLSGMLCLMMLLGFTTSAWAATFKSGESIYVDATACSWYENDGYQASIYTFGGKSIGPTHMEKISSKFYKYTFTSDATFNNVKVFRQPTSKSGWESEANGVEKYLPDLGWTDGNNELIINSNSDNMSVGIYTPPAPNWTLTGSFNNWDITSNVFSSGTTNVTLSANTEYSFKVTKGGSYYGNNGTMARDNCSNWPMSTSDGNCKIATDIAGTYTFTWNETNKQLSVTYPEITYTYKLGGLGKGWSDGGTDMSVSGSTATCTVSLTAKTYTGNDDGFKIMKMGNDGSTTYRGNSGTMKRDNCSGWTMDSDAGNCSITADVAGNYTFSYDINTHKLTVTYPTCTATEPTVNTAAATDVTTNSATLGGNVTDAGISTSCSAQTVDARGIEWTNASGTPSGTKVPAAAGGTGAFTVSAIDLSGGTTYYYKAYATNTTGTSYGNMESFTTLPDLYIRGPIKDGNWTENYYKLDNNGNTYTLTFNPNCSGYENGPKEFIITTTAGDTKIPMANFTSMSGCEQSSRDNNNFKSTLKYLHSDEVTITIVRNSDSDYTISMTKTKGSAPSELYIKGPLVRENWETGYEQPGYSHSSNTYTFEFNAKTNDDRQFCISTTQSGDEGKIHCDMSASGNSGWNLKAEEGTNFQADGSIVSKDDTPIRITVTYNSTSGEFTMTLEKACTPPTFDGYTLSSDSFTYNGTSQAPTVSPKSGYGTPTTTKYGTDLSSATTTEPTNVGTYHVYITGAASGSYCAYTDLDLGTFTISCPTATVFNVTIDKTEFCDTETATILLSGSQKYFNYRLTKNGSASGDATTGTGSVMNFVGIGTSGTWGVQAEPNVTGCTSQAVTQMTGTHTVTVNVAPSVSASSSNTTAYEVITLTSVSGSVTWSKDAADTKAYFVKDNQAVDGDTVDAVSVNFKAPAKDSEYIVGATSNGCTSNLSITISKPTEVCN